MKIGTSKIWVEKYNPRKIEELIVPEKLSKYLITMKEDNEIQNILFNGTPGTGKTCTAKVMAKELGEEPLYVNASIQTSINDIRYTVAEFANSRSLYSDNVRIVILDEFDRLSPEAMDSLKGLMDETIKRCRFILITNNIQRVISPLVSRTQQFSFGITKEEKNDLILQMFKRVQAILKHENIEYDKQTVGKLVASSYPDFRSVINNLQKFSMANGKINEGILNLMDESIIRDLVVSMKSKSFKDIMSFNADPTAFYASFYDELSSHIDNECKPDIYVAIDQYASWAGVTVNLTSNIRSCIIEVMKVVKWI